jgi:polar amino acid transport system substrate-binding protein
MHSEETKNASNRRSVMQLKRVVSVLAVMLLAGAGTAQAQSDNSTLTKIKKAGTMKVCYAPGSPESYKDPKTGEWLGVFVELANELAELMKVKITPVEVQWSTAVLALQRGDCDFFGSSFAYTIPRSLEVAYIRPFRAKGLNVAIPKANPKNFTKLSDLNKEGVKIVAAIGTREYDTAKRLFPKATMVALQFQSDVETLAPVKRGDADATVNAIINISWWLQIPENGSWAKIGFPGEDFGNTPVGWGVKYGDPEWKDFLDSYSGFVAANNRAGELYEVYLAKTNPYVK